MSDDEGNYDMVGYQLQGYTLSDADGGYQMEMIVPACYEPRQAKHIHVKVQGVSRTLTTQVFSGDRVADSGSPELARSVRDSQHCGKRHLRLRHRAGDRKDNVTADLAARV
jgi:protocatechuate 3,4-dioxygenase beta subunit